MKNLKKNDKNRGKREADKKGRVGNLTITSIAALDKRISLYVPHISAFFYTFILLGSSSI